VLFSSSAPHPTPPHSEEDRLDRLRLLRSHRIGPATYRRLIEAHGSAGEALRALPERARAAGVASYRPRSEDDAHREVAAARAAGARAVFLHEPGYPAALRDVADAPPMLWCRGDLALTERPAVAVVGARDASSLGIRMTRSLARGLSEAGFVVVSGLARGVDAVAHDAALRGGTIAVTAGGCDVVYPPQNEALMGRIAEGGLIVSEQPMGLGPQARHFPRRNRIVSGLTRAVVVVEAAARSGTLITARAALDQGREVMAVPGHPFDGRASGCNALIRDGAVLVRGVEDVLEALEAAGMGDPSGPVPEAASGPPPAGAGGAAADAPAPGPGRSARVASHVEAGQAVAPGGGRPDSLAFGDLRARLLTLLGPSPVAEDRLIRDAGAPAERVMAEVMALELDGLVERHPGGLLGLSG
jgi:DNA processing protein